MTADPIAHLDFDLSMDLERLRPVLRVGLELLRNADAERVDRAFATPGLSITPIEGWLIVTGSAEPDRPLFSFHSDALLEVSNVATYRIPDDSGGIAEVSGRFC